MALETARLEICQSYIKCTEGLVDYLCGAQPPPHFSKLAGGICVFPTYKLHPQCLIGTFKHGRLDDRTCEKMSYDRKRVAVACTFCRSR